MLAALFNMFVGLALMAAPGLLGFDKTTSDHYYIVAPLIITFSITALWEVNRSARFLNLLVGVWFVISPFLFEFSSSAAKWIAVVAGMIVALLSLIRGTIKGNYGGGWRSLFQNEPAHFVQAQRQHGTAESQNIQR